MALKWITSGVNDTAVNYRKDITVLDDGQELITLDTPYIMGIEMLEIHRNGVLLERDTYEEVNATTIRYLDSSFPLRAGETITVTFKGTEVNLGDIRLVDSYAEVLAIANPRFNQVVLVTSTKMFYKYGNTGWQPFIIPYSTKNVGMYFQYEKQDIVDITNTTFTLATTYYQPDTNGVLVFIDGRKVDPSSYTEVDSMTITFHEALPVGSQEIEFLSVDADSWEESNSHSVSYDYDEKKNVKSETVRLDNGFVKETTYNYDSDGNISTETIVKGNKTIIKTYHYDSDGDIYSVDVEVLR